MSLKKFGHSDIIRNAMRAYPHNNFFIYSSSVYYDHRPIESGSFSNDIVGAAGGISLFEYNIDKSGSTKFLDDALGRTSLSPFTFLDTNPPIIPFVYKSSVMNYLKSSQRIRNISGDPSDPTIINVSGPMQEVSDDYVFAPVGSALTGSSYSMTASITRELMETAGTIGSEADIARPKYRHYYSLKNSLNFYGARSPHYSIKYSDNIVGEWNKDQQDINLISIPKIFYGTRIKPGSLSLKFYITGTLVGELQDTKYNGELIQVGPPGSNGSGSVAGVALYEGGFALLTGSWKLTDQAFDFAGSGGDPRVDFITGSWLYFAAGANDGVGSSTVAATSTSASFNMSFKGHTETQVLTMYAHARRGEVNYSNNPTFLTHGQTKVSVSSSNMYIESDSQTIKNTVSSSFEGFEAPFERQVYVSRVAIYDDDKKLIGVATLSNPVLKKEAQDLSFKLKLDL